MAAPITLAKRPDASLSSARVLPDLTQSSSVPSQEQLLAMLAALQEENAKLRSQPARAISFKVSDKGALCVYGLGRFPVTLYISQWERLLGAADDIRAFAKANAATLTRKD
jgi:hypothetical protein